MAFSMVTRGYVLGIAAVLWGYVQGKVYGTFWGAKWENPGKGNGTLSFQGLPHNGYHCGTPGPLRLRLATLDAGASPHTPASITRLWRWLQTALCVHSPVYAPPFPWSAGKQEGHTDKESGVQCVPRYSSLRSMRGPAPAPPFNNKTPAVATGRIVCAPLYFPPVTPPPYFAQVPPPRTPRYGGGRQVPPGTEEAPRRFGGATSCHICWGWSGLPHRPHTRNTRNTRNTDSFLLKIQTSAYTQKYQLVLGSLNGIPPPPIFPLFIL